MKQILFLLFPGMEILDFSGPLQTFFEAKNYGCPISITYCSWLQEITTTQGVVLHKPDHFSNTTPCREDMIIIPGVDHRIYTDNGLKKIPGEVFEWLIKAHKNGVTLCSICTGAFILGHAGLLDGRKCTTHWKRVGELEKTYPNAHVQTDTLFTHDHDIYTSAGIASGIDLSLALIDKFWGPNVTAKVARELVVYMRRDSQHGQASIYLDFRDHINPVVHKVQDRLISHPEENSSIEALAQRFGLSPRHLTRLFKKATGITIKQYKTLVRLAHAKHLMQSPDNNIEAIADKCGFHDGRQLRRLWNKHFGTTPSKTRRQDM